MEQYGWLPPEWTEYGARWGKDNRLYLAEWRHGFEVHQLRALFFECQQVKTLKFDLNAALSDLEATTAQIEVLESRIGWYRCQVTREARLYPLFTDLK